MTPHPLGRRASNGASVFQLDDVFLGVVLVDQQNDRTRKPRLQEIADAPDEGLPSRTYP
jgi:hypothetical protein